MHRLPDYSRILLLTEGRLGVFTSKTAAALLRYRGEHVVGVIDSVAAGRSLREFIPWAGEQSIFASMADALLSNRPLGASAGRAALFIGIAPTGGALPPEMRRHVVDALAVGLDVVSGLHTFLADDSELANAAARSGARLFDLRRPPAARVVANGRARETRCRRVLTVGSDCNVGKMVAALELTRAARRRGLDARFAATGQTGTMIAGQGVTIDAVVADFVAGAAEQLVLAQRDADVCLIEGQGSLAHPGFSGVTLALLHGCCPDALVFVHHLGRTHFKSAGEFAIPPLRDLFAAYERLSGYLHPARVRAVALNAVDSSEPAYRAAVHALETAFNIPVADPIRDGSDRLLDAVLA